MSILQKLNRITFFKFFFFTTIIFVETTNAQNVIKPQEENKNKAVSATTTDKITNSNLTRPYRKTWYFSVQNLHSIVNASDNVRELILTTTDGKIFLLNAETTEKIWETDLGGRFASKPLVTDNHIYLTTYATESSNSISNTKIAAENKSDPSENKREIKYMTVRSLNVKTGLPEWQIKLPYASDLSSWAAGSTSSLSSLEQTFLYEFNAALVILDTNNDNLTLLNKEDGTVLWRRELNSKISAAPFFSKNNVILATVEKQILFVSLVDGNTTYSTSIPETASTLNYIEEKRLLIWGSRKGKASSIIVELKNSTQNAVWKFRNGGAEISSITLTDQGILLTSLDNFMYLISKDRGELIWKKRLGGRITDAPLIRDGYIFVTNVAESFASILDLSTGKTVNKISLSDDFYFIAKPLSAANKVFLTTQKGIFAFEDGIPIQ